LRVFERGDALEELNGALKFVACSWRIGVSGRTASTFLRQSRATKKFAHGLDLEILSRRNLVPHHEDHAVRKGLMRQLRISTQ
jgi:hypothetical protein